MLDLSLRACLSYELNHITHIANFSVYLCVDSFIVLFSLYVACLDVL